MSILFSIKKNDIKKSLRVQFATIKVLNNFRNFFKNKFVFFRTVSCKIVPLFLGISIHQIIGLINNIKKKFISIKKKVGINFNYEKLRIFRYQQLYNFLKKNKI